MVGAMTIHEAAASGDVERIRSLLSSDGSLAENVGEAGESPLLCAIRAGSIEATGVLLDAGARASSLRAGGDDAREVVRQLPAAAREELLPVLVANGLPVEWLSAEDREAFGEVVSAGVGLDAPSDIAPLHEACGEGELLRVRVLLRHGARLEVRDSDGDTPLLCAARSNYPEVIEELLKAGADIEAPNTATGDTPATTASVSGSDESLRTLIEHGCELGATNGRDAVLYGSSGYVHSLSCIRLLLEAGARVDETNRHGETALHVAAGVSSHDVAELLLEAGAAVDARDDTSATPLMHAADWQNDSVIEILVKAGADLEARDEHGKTALFFASESDHMSLAKNPDAARTVATLLRLGAKPDARDAVGATPLLAACSCGLAEVVRTLLEGGADPYAADHNGDDAFAYADEHPDSAHRKEILVLLDHASERSR